MDVLRADMMDAIQKQIRQCEFRMSVYGGNPQVYGEVDAMCDYILKMMTLMGYSDVEINEVRFQFENIVG